MIGKNTEKQIRQFIISCYESERCGRGCLLWIKGNEVIKRDDVRIVLSAEDEGGHEIARLPISLRSIIAKRYPRKKKAVRK
jgi:hypothetical protein